MDKSYKLKYQRKEVEDMIKRIFKITLAIILTICAIKTNDVYAYADSKVPSYLFDANYYCQKYQDLREIFGCDYNALYDHWIHYGKAEGRSPSPAYNPDYYLKSNPDLKAIIGNDYVKLYDHWCQNGIYEFRASSELYDGSYYRHIYGDLQDAFGNSAPKYLQHFVEYGMKEGRQANPDFNVFVYKSTYNDLRDQFGDDLTLYYYHYINYGVAEGRTAKGTTIPTPPSSTKPEPINPIKLIDNVSKVNLLRQSSKTCKASAVAQSLNIIIGDNRYTTKSLGNNPCKSINGLIYTGSDGCNYMATYKQDDYKGNRAEQQAKIDQSLSAGLPIVVTVHKTTSGTKHHWVTIIGKTGNTYQIIDPATGTIRTMSEARYDFGLTDYSNGSHYGYVCFTKIN